MVRLAAGLKEQYPFRSHWLDLNGSRYHYLDEGPHDGAQEDAPTVVMVHGNPTWSFYYRNLVRPLSRTHRVIVPDHLGCGYSDKPQDYGYTIADHIGNLERLVDHLALKSIIWVMHDWGGAIAMGCAGRHPSSAAGFVVFNTAAFMFPTVPWRIRVCRSNGFGQFLVRGLNAFVGLGLQMGTSQKKRFTSQVKSGYLAPYNNWRNRIAVHRFVQEIPIEADHPTHATVAEIEGGLAQFRQHPMLILWGADDFCFTEAHVLPQWRTRFPEAKVVVLEDAGHFVVEDAHDRIEPLITDFVADVKPPA